VPKDIDGLVPGHRLLPHERWFVAFGVRQRRKIPGLRSSKLDQNYGPVGVALFGAGLSTILPAMVGNLIGWSLLLTSGERQPMVTIAFWTMGVCVVLMIPGGFRIIQAAEAGKRFRGDRPFQKGR
jgi:hypothetical protein